MALPCPGPNSISLGNIQTEFGGSNPTSISEYYRNGSYVPNIDTNTKVPTSGKINFSDFFCSVNEIVRYITSTTTNVNASSYFTNSEWTSTAQKRLVVNANVIVGSTNVSNYAITIPSGFGGKFQLDNNGSIQGAGGAANGGTGGPAIYAGGLIKISNNGTIYAGGGGGGQGSTASNSQTVNVSSQQQLSLAITATSGGGLGQGYNQTKTNSQPINPSYNISYTSTNTQTFLLRFPPNSTINITNNTAYTRRMYFSSGSNITLNQNASGIGNISSNGCLYYQGVAVQCGYASIFALGGITMSGTNNSIIMDLIASGVYELVKDPNQSVNVPTGRPGIYTPNTVYSVVNQSGLTDQTDGQVTVNNTNYLMPSLSGSPSGAGAGGDWGQNGNNGSTGNGGLAGYYIVNNSNVTWLNTGTVAGRVN